MVVDRQQAEVLDDLLCRWHQWTKEYRPVRSWKGKALVVGEYSAGRHDCWDDDDDALDERTMRAVDAAVDRLPELLRAAIQQEARNLSVGYEVFISPRLPADPKRRRETVDQAREQLGGLLRLSGVL